MIARHVEIVREALLDKMEAAGTRVLIVTGPAGFGKTTSARQFAARRENSAVCDCADIADTADFARRLIPALANESPSRRGPLSQTELLLSDGSPRLQDRVNVLLSAWRDPQPESLLVFDNAESVMRRHDLSEFFSLLVRECPDSRTIAICTRDSKVQCNRFAPPHLIMTVGPEDLAFRLEDIRDIMCPLGVSDATIRRIADVTRGWPIAVSLLANFARLGTLGDLLDRLEDVAYDALHEYLVSEVFGQLDAGFKDALFVLTAVPRATITDVELACGSRDVATRFQTYARGSPFVVRHGDDSYSIHPLIATILCRDRADDRDDILKRLAIAYESSEDFLRAAELHLARLAYEQAAQALDRVPVAEYHALPMRYAQVLASLDRSIVQRYPTLWSAGALVHVT